MSMYLKWSALILGIMVFMGFVQQDPTQDFLNKAVQSNRFEIALAQQAGQRTSNESLKSYSQMLVKEHQKMLNELQQYATAHNLTFSDKMDQEHQSRLDSLGSIQNDVYDQSFRNAAIASHQKSISLFEQANSETGVQDTVLRGWINDKLPSLKSHLTKAEELNLEMREVPNNTTPPVQDTITMEKRQ